MVLRPALFNLTPLNHFRPLVNTTDTSSSVLSDVRHTRRRGLQAPNAEHLQRVPRIVYEILPSLSPHGRMNHDLTLAAGMVLRPAMFTLSSPSPPPSIAAGLSSLSMPLGSMAASPRPQLFRAPVPLLWLYLSGRSLGTTTMLSNHRDPGSDRLVSFLLVSLRSVEYLSTPAVLKAR